MVDTVKNDSLALEKYNDSRKTSQSVIIKVSFNYLFQKVKKKKKLSAAVAYSSPYNRDYGR